MRSTRICLGVILPYALSIWTLVASPLTWSVALPTLLMCAVACMTCSFEAFGLGKEHQAREVWVPESYGNAPPVYQRKFWLRRSGPLTARTATTLHFVFCLLLPSLACIRFLTPGSMINALLGWALSTMAFASEAYARGADQERARSAALLAGAAADAQRGAAYRKASER